MEQIHDWNSACYPEIIDDCIHKLIEKQATECPNAPAIRAWDREFSYGELNAASNRLAHHLTAKHHLQVGQVVHVMFEKSAWYFVAILAINKAGGLWAPLDPSYPLQRLQTIVSQTKSRLALTSPSYAELGVQLTGTVVEVTPRLDVQLSRVAGTSDRAPETAVTPRDPVYLLFTSGSTGTPKGYIMEHGGVTTSQVAIGRRLGLHPGVRILQFATFVFDLSIGEILGPLLFGACIYVPSEEARLNALPEFIRDSGVNWMYLTPAFTRTLSPESFPGLELLLLAGEAVGRDVLEAWFGRVRLFNGWGPAETCCFSTLHEWKSVDESPMTIGRPVGGLCWIVDPEDPLTLLPAGEEGEVVIQGPSILLGYIGDEEKTERAVVRNLPSWAPRRDDGPYSRFYKSGDLASYNRDGTINFISRKDTQIKIRGLRVELEEIEHHVRQHLRGAKQVVVDVLRAGSTASLVTYFAFTTETKAAPALMDREGGDTDIFMNMEEDVAADVEAMVEKISAILPQYMVPTIFVPCRHMPFITSTKLDRNALRRMATSLSKPDLALYSLQSKQKSAPETDMEIRMQALWASVLGLPADMVGREDSFLRFGGDSISAIRLVNAARIDGILLNVKDVFEDPRLSAVAATAVDLDVDQDESGGMVEPFSLLPPHIDRLVQDGTASELCGLQLDQYVEDAYPCTAIQQGLMALAIKEPGSYIAKWVYRLDSDTDITRFKAAWDAAADRCTNMRTRIVQLRDMSVQVVINRDTNWVDTTGKTLKSFCREVESWTMGLGTPLSYNAVLEDTDGQSYFVWIGHHTIYDGWAMRVMLNAMSDAYHDETTFEQAPYSGFIKYTTQLDATEASDFWREELQGANRAAFPPKRSSDQQIAVVDQNQNTRFFSKKIYLARDGEEESIAVVTQATLLRAAWALILARYCETNDITFCTTVSGRQAPVNGLEAMAGPAIATIPVRIRIDPSLPVEDFLHGVQTKALETVPYEQFGLQNIARVSDDARDACDFSSLMVLQPMKFLSGMAEDILDLSSAEGVKKEEFPEGFFNYPLVAQIYVYEDYVNLVLTYKSDIVAEPTLSALAAQYEHVVKQLMQARDIPLSEISIAGEWDLSKAEAFNNDPPEIIEKPLHELIAAFSHAQPDAPAIDAWDKKLTYGELDTVSNRLANYLLQQFNIKTRDLVHVCFDKSAWHFVAVLAIMKAGAAWVPLDPSHPANRQKHVTRQTGATLVLCCPSNAEECASLDLDVLVVGPELDARISDQYVPSSTPAIHVSSRDAAYVLFTSGSTGTPKGLVMEHGAVTTSALTIGKRLGMTSHVRMLQFAAFVFDLSIGEIFGPLIHGACLCVPSEQDRLNNIAAYINANRVNWMYLTPAFARTIDPTHVPGVELLVFAGEAVSRDVFEQWFGKVRRLINGWGPAETCCFSTFHEWTSLKESPLTIGRPFSSHCWIVDPEDPMSLAPIGTMGEVVLQGPTLLREYLADKEKTEKAMISNLPSWAPRRSQLGWDRFFRSGDLCSYNPDGTIEFGTRLDTQIKIRGLRVELSEIEYHIVDSLEGVRQVAVDVLRTETGTRLVAYFCFSDTSSGSGGSGGETPFLPMDPGLSEQVTAMVGKLGIALPQYMIPSLFIPCHHMPFITSTKLDRKGLKAMTEKLDDNELAAYALQDGPKAAPQTTMESRLQSIWAEVLNKSVESIGRDDSFLRIGGDSVAAIHLITAARRDGIQLTVKDIFDDPRLCSVADRAIEIGMAEATEYKPFSLLDGEAYEEALNVAEDQCGISRDKVLDAYPCSPVQDGFMALSAKQPGSYITKYFFKLPAHVDPRRFKLAWELTLAHCPNLTTRIINADKSALQLILSESAQWEDTDGMDRAAFVKVTDRFEMTYGSRLTRYGLITEPNDDKYFIWICHHSVIDGWTLRLVQDTIRHMYWDTEPPRTITYAGFVKYTRSLAFKGSDRYWAEQLEGATKLSFPNSSDMTGPRAEMSVYTKTINIPLKLGSSITKASIIRGAWSLLLSRHASMDDVVFGETLSGRDAPVPGLQDMAGPTIATVPVRVRLDRSQSVASFLQNVQSKASEMIDHQHYGLHNIARLGNDGPKEAVDFTTLLVMQPQQYLDDNNADEDAVIHFGHEQLEMTEQEMKTYFNYPLVLQGHMSETQLDCRFFHDTSVLSHMQAEALAYQLDHVIHQLAELNDSSSINDISLVGPWDVEHAVASSRLMPGSDSLVHERIRKTINRQPDDEAIVGWDGNLSYRELGDMTTRLAAKLQELGVGPESLVPFCFPKSTWAAVSMVAIEMAGAAFVPLDPSAPPERIQGILEDVGAQLVVCSPSTEEMLKQLGVNTLCVTENMVKDLNEHVTVSSDVGHNNACLVIFTSGSTGKPKGMVHTHGSFCSNADGFGNTPGVGRGTRVYAFSAYVFDVGITDVLITLIHGGTICIPSDHDRHNNLAGSINALKANWLFTTPTVAGIVHPKQVPLVKTLCVGGEAITSNAVDPWLAHGDVHGIYGPAEACICSWRESVGRDGDSANLGLPLSAAFWIVEPDDLTRLVPVGCVGEALIEGPTLARGYLNVDSDVSAAFIDDASWLPQLPGVVGPRRVYRSGDLVRRNADGTHTFVGRKDTQVKLHGQRIELGEIEVHLARHLPHDMEGIIDVIRTDAGSEILAALLWCRTFENGKSNEFRVCNGDDVSEDMRTLVAAIEDNLTLSLPRYMVPSTYILFNGQPRQTSSGKVNRRHVTAVARATTAHDRAIFARGGKESSPPTTEIEFRLRDLWARVLGIEAETIGKNDSFLQLGGDSITAIKLSTLARREGLLLYVNTIFKQSRLCQMSLACQPESGQDVDSSSAYLLPFSMLSEDEKNDIIARAKEQCVITEDEDIEDIFPCSRLQEGLMALAIKQPGSYLAKEVYRLAEHVDIARFKAAWDEVVSQSGNLRTRIIRYKNQILQAVMASHDWETRHKDMQSFMAGASRLDVGFGDALCRFSLYKEDDGHYYFGIVIHHAVFDGWSLGLIFSALREVYAGAETPGCWFKPYSSFVDYVNKIDMTKAAAFWGRELAGASRAAFPPSPPRTKSKPETAILSRLIEFSPMEETSITRATVLRAAWAVILGRYCNTSDVTFGATVSGRNAPVPGLTEVTGPVIATLPIRVRLDKLMLVEDFLERIQHHAHDLVEFEQYGLQNIQKLSPEIAEAVQFSSLVVVQPFKQMGLATAGTEAELFTVDEGKLTLQDAMAGYFSYPLVIQFILLDNHVELNMTYNPQLLGREQLTALSHQFESVVHQFAHPLGKLVGDVNMTSAWDEQQAQIFNSNEVTIHNSLLHEMIDTQSLLSPDAPAVHAWDGKFSYREYVYAANGLAHLLVDEYHVQPDELVHVVFDHSVWFLVSILAINKAGAAWVPLDPSQPTQRHRQVTSQTRARLALCSSHYVSKCMNLDIPHVLSVDSSLHKRLAQDEENSTTAPAVDMSAEYAAYVLFTSGSTGVPKGLVMTHRGVCTSMSESTARIGISSSTNVLQFSSYVFDFCVAEICGPLIRGGTVFVPSEDDRMNRLVQFINDTGINTLYLTPSFARTIRPAQVPGVGLLLLAGESVPQDVLHQWFGNVRVMNGWGPAEVCCFSTLHEFKTAQDSPLNVGKPVSGLCWIVDPEDPHRLAPIGTEGEILIQSPAILRHYLEDPVKTAATIMVEMPDWAHERSIKPWDRMFKSGDLGYYNADGTIQFSSRKDTQIKIRGLRVELGEVEFHVRGALDHVKQCAVDVFKTEAGSSILVAYLCFTNQSRTAGSAVEEESLFLSLGTELQQKLVGAVTVLSTALPRYMIPTHFIPVTYMPFITSTKLDRKMLNKTAASLSQRELNMYGLQYTEKRAPATATEITLQQIWADVLEIPADSIGCDDSFLGIGGDSISAIHVAAAARQQGIVVKVKDIFRDPRLCSIAAASTAACPQDADLGDVAPFELIVSNQYSRVKDDILSQCGLASDDVIQDAYPCTGLQEGLMALSIKQPGSYVTKYFFQIPSHIDLDRWKHAWERTVRLCNNLRTRLIMSRDQCIQVVIKDDIEWDQTQGQNLESFIAATNTYDMGYGSRLCRYGIVQQSTLEKTFVWTTHHSIIDGWSVQIALKVLAACYWEQDIPRLAPFPRFIKHTLHMDRGAAEEFWRNQLSGARRLTFPPSAADIKAEYKVAYQTIQTPETRNASITKASVLRAAWSLVLSRHCNSDNVVFGATVSGRQAAVDGLQDMPGPVLATVPIHVAIDREKPISVLLQNIQNQSSDMTTYEQFGLQNISKLGAEEREACNFTSLMVTQPKQFVDEQKDSVVIDNSESTLMSEKEMGEYFNYSLVLLSLMHDDHVQVHLFYDSHVLSGDLVQAIAKQLDHVMQQLFDDQDMPLEQVSLLGAWELEEAKKSGNLKGPTEKLIHGMFEEYVKLRPSAPAVCAWDGNMTYQELACASKRLAGNLQHLGVGPEVMVIVCFPKSIWAVVAVMAIQFAGGAFVPVDASTPAARLGGILKDTQTTLVLCAQEHVHAFDGVKLRTLIVDGDLIESLPHHPAIDDKVQPHNASFVTFTSGSTGKPKGIVHEHRTAASSSDGYGACQDIGFGTRVFAYSAHTFDIGTMDMLVTLSRGACVCVPSAHDRYNDIPGAINRLQANWAFLTPTVASLFDPRDTPSLRSVSFGGEVVTKRLVDTWMGSGISIHGLYGPAEATICAWRPSVGSMGKPSNIGNPLSSIFWIVEPDNHRKLVPIGCVGELVIQGPLLARGYLNADEASNAAWLHDVNYYPVNTPFKAYKTGDLVRRNEDGTFDYVRRKDTQVKLHGQRVELGEIEDRVQQHLPRNMSSIVEVVAREGHDEKDTLTALFWYTEGPETLHQVFQLADTVNENVQRLISDTDNALSVVLPSHMIPSSYLIFHGTPPKTSSGKVDRRSICEVAGAIPSLDRLRFSPVVSAEPPKSDVEYMLRDIWAEVLNTPATSIGRLDSFLRVGGDSVTAIKVVSMANQRGLSLSVRDIFADPRLCSVAESTIVDSLNNFTDVEPFAMLKFDNDDLDLLLGDIQGMCSLGLEDGVEDAYPCTPFQQGLMAVSSKQPGSYMSHEVHRLGKGVSLERFRAAWNLTTEMCKALRTRIVTYRESVIQVVISQEPIWEDGTDITLTNVAKYVRNLEAGYGSRLSYQMLFKEGDDYYFSWVSHHSIYDGVTKHTVFNILSQVYNNIHTPPLPPFTRFVKYVEDLDQSAAKSYWSHQLEGAMQTEFPIMSDPKQGTTRTTRIATKSVPLPSLYDTSITKASVIRAAWALVLSKREGQNDVTFGATVSGRQASIPGLMEIPGPTTATVPVRTRVDMTQTMREYLSAIQAQATGMIPHEQFGLQNISRLDTDAAAACNFSSLLVVQPVGSLFMGKSEDRGEGFLEAADLPIQTEERLDGFFNYPLVLQALVSDDQVELMLIYDASVVFEAQAQSLLQHLDLVIAELANNSDNSDKTLGDVPVSTDWDISHLVALNKANEPKIIEHCIHTLISDQAVATPNGLAVDAWDRSLTYRELDEASTLLSHYLIDYYNVQPGDMILLCFEKTAYYIVAFLGILKSGAAWVPIDRSHPKQRWEEVARQTKSKLALLSANSSTLFKGVVDDAVEVSDSLFAGLAEMSLMERFRDPVKVDPHDVAYVFFTSGSTGVPKGIVMEHWAVSSSQAAWAKRFDVGAQTRWLQFSSYVFDAVIGETISPLISGGCVCIPSEAERLDDTAGFVNRFRVNAACLTPSFARSLNPDDVPGLKLLTLHGEAIGRDVFEKWYGKTRFVNAWGPTESCYIASTHEWAHRDEPVQTIGYPVGGITWVVDVNDPTRLASVGTVGELVVQGPTLMREYLSDPAKTAAVIIDEVPSWAHRQDKPQLNRIYRTGDLACYDQYGRVVYMARKDSQVKVRGLRVELGEIEHHIHNLLDVDAQVVVDVLKIHDSTLIIAFIYCKGIDGDTHSSESDMLLPMHPALSDLITDMLKRLRGVVPPYMVPSMFLPCTHMPFSVSGKLDRSKLRNVAKALAPEDMAMYSLSHGEKRQPETDAERDLQAVWSLILHCPVESIGRDDNFFQIGGDSITSISLVAQGRSLGILLTASEVFKNPVLSDMARVAQPLLLQQESQKHVLPFGLLGESVRIDLGRTKARADMALSPSVVIEDAYPVTALQEGLMALSVRQPGSYIAKHIYRLDNNVDQGKFRQAWESTVRACTNLRTRIIRVRDQSVQVILGDETLWDQTKYPDLKSFIKSSNSMNMTYGSRLNHFNLITDKDGSLYFVWIAHHAVFDGWSVSLVLEALNSFYAAGEPTHLQPYSRFIDYAMQIDTRQAQTYWKHQLEGAKQASWPPLQGSDLTDTPSTRVLRKALKLEDTLEAGITKASVIRAAWAAVLARYCDTDDICFATTTSGRQASVSGVTDMPGPMVATVPVRIKINHDITASSFLDDIQKQAADMVAFEQFGLQNISQLSPTIKAACDFSSLLVVQPMQQLTAFEVGGDSVLASVDFDDLDASALTEGYFTYPLVVQGLIYSDQIEWVLLYDPDVLGHASMEALLHQLHHFSSELASKPNESLSQIPITGPYDLAQASSFNQEIPDIIDATIPQLFQKVVEEDPNAPAIYAWDGTFTYHQLEHASNRLAHYLVTRLGVQRGEMVHVCFEKSAWHFVSILAINKAGAAWVPLDPSHPIDRLRQVTRQTQASLVLSSPSNTELCQRLLSRVLCVDASLDDAMKRAYPSDAAPEVKLSSRDAIYVLFTSGTTGTPKGFVLEHQAVATSQTAIAKRLGMSGGTRVLQFAAYVFDLSISEIVCPLISGACICVPSEQDRLGHLPEFIGEAHVNWLLLTPSFVQTLKPEDVPGVELLLLAGEPCTRAIIDTWFSHVRLLNIWGPAETCVMSSIHEYSSMKESPNTIGRPVGCDCWVVDPDDHARLAPVGTTGEVIIQGPTLLREYLADPAKTKQSTCQAPVWAPRHSKDWSRCFKSGDLARYNLDGTLEFISRKDTQVKLRGLRIELGEVEHHVKFNFQDAEQIIVDVYQGGSGHQLACFFSLSTERRIMSNTNDNPALELDHGTRERLAAVKRELVAALPQYMVPTLWIPLRWVPVVTSTKIDRLTLREVASDLAANNVAAYSLEENEKREPRTEMELQVREICATVLDRSPSSIGIDDNFYHLGGDSIRVITLGRMIEQQLDVKLGRSLLNGQRATVFEIASQIDAVQAGTDGHELSGVDLMGAIRKDLGPLLEEPLEHLVGNYQTTMPEDSVVFLTGATGYLGSEILRHLLNDSTVGTVITHVRASTPESGLRRLKQPAEIYGWWDDAFASKIEVWVGDLSHAQLGLNDEEWDRLVGRADEGNVDSIIHNGAVVNWNAGYTSLQAANVQSVVDLLGAAMVSPRNPKFVFVSGGIMMDTQSDIAATATELSGLTGYIQTKFVAESIINEVARRLPEGQNRISTIKPGRIIGTAGKGIANLDDYLWRVVATSIALGVHPEDSHDSWMPSQGVDMISSIITSNLHGVDGITAFQNLNTGLPVSTFWALVSSQISNPLRSTSWEDWTQQAMELAESAGGEKHPIYAVQNFLGGIGVVGQPELDQERNDSEHLEHAVKLCTQYLVKTGFIEVCKGHDVKMQNIVQRSTGVKF